MLCARQWQKAWTIRVSNCASCSSLARSCELIPYATQGRLCSVVAILQLYATAVCMLPPLRPYISPLTPAVLHAMRCVAVIVGGSVRPRVAEQGFLVCIRQRVLGRCCAVFDRNRSSIVVLLSPPLPCLSMTSAVRATRHNAPLIVHNHHAKHRDSAIGLEG